MMRTLNLDGDRQADLKVHGGVNKAVYGYPSEHYVYWRQELPEMDLPWGVFGENLTVEGLDESTLRIGARFRIGSAEIRVTEPRLPCYKLGIKFGNQEFLRTFLLSGRTGFYFSVQREGEVGPGDEIELVEDVPESVTIADLVRLYSTGRDDQELLRRAIATEALDEGWRELCRKQLERITNPQ